MPAFTPATAAAAARRSHAPGAARRNHLKHALALEAMLFDAAVSISKQRRRGEPITLEHAAALTGLAKGWETCQNRIRILRGKPTPGSLRHPITQPKERKPRRPMVTPKVLGIPGKSALASLPLAPGLSDQSNVVAQSSA
jgi:hypothetical protein